MDSSLLKDLADFKKRAASRPAVEAKRPKPTSTSTKSKTPVNLPKELAQPKKPAPSSLDYKTPKFRSKHKFAVMAAIVDFMKKRHLKREFTPLSLTEILDHINYTDISQSDKNWLGDRALKENPKLIYKDDKYAFNPKYNIKDRKQLLRLLEKHEERGYGGVYLDDIRESLPDADNVIRSIPKRIIFITKPDKKVVLFNKNKTYNITVDEEFQKHWRAISVDGIGEADIDKYLNNAGIVAMQDSGVSQKQTPQRKKSRKRKQFKKLNDHLDESMLKDYTQEQNH
ncbi:general transcription factor IIE subunit 2 [Exaiptasia diaphana]|uniref:Transcription initiation factor IIE subunit beta n=1 Tax=Exaiptasia diaphana TaxID=2652724 RepID=A0A913WP40_EXADI|nr:general transcription factor IIE subunit 2 [Exaiptasia diaphana]KXJ19154.1 General transcription factor IIE subunit 2 [Exaiptasia diaphana]